MKKINLLIVLLILIILGGCAKSSPTNYYTLSSFLDHKEQSSIKAEHQNVSVLIAFMPRYLERNQVAVRQASAVTITYSDYELWAEPIRQGFARVLVEALNHNLIPKAGAIIYRSGQADYRLSVEVSSFEGGLNSFAELETSWQLKHKEELIRNGFFKKKLATGLEMESLVDAQSKLLVAFANALYEEIQEIIQ